MFLWLLGDSYGTKIFIAQSPSKADLRGQCTALVTFSSQKGLLTIESGFVNYKFHLNEFHRSHSPQF